MSFLVPCPNCGPRSAYEFRFGGEVRTRPRMDASDDEWTDYIYTRANRDGLEKEWWYHRDGCGKWFVAERDTISNFIETSYWVEEAAG